MTLPAFAKAKGHKLYYVREGERSVSELEEQLGLRQPTISQQLARLRADDLVATRRDGKTIYYSLASEEARRVVQLLYELFCDPTATVTTKRQPRLATAGK